MRKLFLIPLFAVSLTSCSIIDDNIAALEYNKSQVDASTCAIEENTQAIERANQRIIENRQQLEAINGVLEKVSKS